MVGLAALIVIIVFVGYIINSLAKGHDSRKLGRKVAELQARLLTESDERRHEEIEREIERTLHLMDVVEKRDSNPLR